MMPAKAAFAALSMVEVTKTSLSVPLAFRISDAVKSMKGPKSMILKSECYSILLQATAIELMEALIEAVLSRPTRALFSAHFPRCNVPLHMLS